MDLYDWGEMRRLYAERVGKNKSLPKTMDNYFQSYRWLRGQPRFEQHFVSRDKSNGLGSTKKKGRPGPGRDKSKKAKVVEDAVDQIKSKVTAAVLSSQGKKTPHNDDETMKFRSVIEDGFKAINKTTNQLVMNQVMSEAPATEKHAYFSALRASAMDEVEHLQQVLLASCLSD